MDDRQWVAVGYPFGISCFAVLCLFALYDPSEEDGNSSETSEIKQPTTITERAGVTTQEQKDIKPPTANTESQHTNIPKRLSLYFAAFWLTLQYYTLLRMGTKIKVAEHEQTGFVWVAMIALFLPTLVVWISAAKLASAVATFEAHQRLNKEPEGLFVLSVELVGSSFLLLLVPWIQAVYVLI